MHFVVKGCRDLAYELFKSKLPIKRKLLRILFRFHPVRSIVRGVLDAIFGVSSRTARLSKQLWLDGFQTISLENDVFIDKIKDELSVLEFTSDSGLKFSSLCEVLNTKTSDFRFLAMNPHNNILNIVDFAMQPYIFNIVKEYLGDDAKLHTSVCWISKPCDFDADHFEFGYHRDIASWKWLNLFIYLNDVGELQGPHRCVKGTHKASHFGSFLERRISLNRLLSNYSRADFVTFLGNKYTGIFEDTSNYHAASQVIEGHRFMLQLNFSALNNFDI